jgi:hypothetical protein
VPLLVNIDGDARLGADNELLAIWAHALRRVNGAQLVLQQVRLIIDHWQPCALLPLSTIAVGDDSLQMHSARSSCDRV